MSLINSRTEKIIIVSNYRVANLAALKNDGYNIDGLNDAEKAKIIYLTHHLSLANARRFIKSEITEESAWELLKAQVGLKSASAKVEDYGGSIIAHRIWLTNFIDKHLNLNNYYCPEMFYHAKLIDVNLIQVIKNL